MTQSAFALALENELQARRAPFDQAELLEFVAVTSPLIAEGPDLVR
jgi:hypothetical protein